jgi:copper(I)-binding protein
MSAAGAMKMQQVPSVVVPAGKDLTFAPSAYHVMLMQPKDRSLLTDGKRFPLTLHFEKAGDVTVEVAVQKQRQRPAARTNTHTDQLTGARHEPAAQQLAAAPALIAGASVAAG